MEETSEPVVAEPSEAESVPSADAIIVPNAVETVEIAAVVPSTAVPETLPVVEPTSIIVASDESGKMTSAVSISTPTKSSDSTARAPVISSARTPAKSTKKVVVDAFKFDPATDAPPGGLSYVRDSLEPWKDHNPEARIPAEVFEPKKSYCVGVGGALRTFRKAVSKKKKEVLIGNREIYAVYIKRFIPALFWKINKNEKST